MIEEFTSYRRNDWPYFLMWVSCAKVKALDVSNGCVMLYRANKEIDGRKMPMTDEEMVESLKHPPFYEIKVKLS